MKKYYHIKNENIIFLFVNEKQTKRLVKSIDWNFLRRRFKLSYETATRMWAIYCRKQEIRQHSDEAGTNGRTKKKVMLKLHRTDLSDKYTDV